MISPILAFIASLAFACGLDALIGDPAVRVHPVRLIGHLALACEQQTRRFFAPRIAGIVTWFVVVAVTLAGGASLSWTAWHWQPLAGIGMDGLLIWAAMAPRDLADHALRVLSPLLKGDLPAARLALSRIVGRRTQNLDTPGIIRASVEAVAESSVDGIIAPLFWAALLGPVGALVYRGINTMDSLFGHRSERYAQFGWLPARADDVANWLPARLSIVPIFCSAALLGFRPAAVCQIFRRDRLKHDSPNAAHAEAAFAGALGLQLGGVAEYAEGIIAKPLLGIARNPPSVQHIKQAIWLMLLASLISVLLVMALRAGILAAFIAITEHS